MPRHASALNCLGVLLAQQGKLDEGASYFQQAAAFEPMDSDAHNNLGLVHARRGRIADAIRSYERALAIRPDFSAARNNLELARRELRCAENQVRSPGSNDVFLHNPHSTPSMPPSSTGPGGGVSAAQAAYAANVRGIALAQEGKYDKAWAQFQFALQVEPSNIDAHTNLGSVLNRQKRHDEALGHYQQVLSRDPNHVTANYNIGVVLADQGRDEEAVAQYKKTLRLQPDHVDAHYNLGILLARHGHVEDAIAEYDLALRFKPDHAGAHWNRAMLLLSKGDFEHGWPAYEWRWAQPGVVKHSFKQPLWDGSPLNGRTILLHAEQGLGDTLQFVRYARLVKQRGGRVVVQCQTPLSRILGSAAGVDSLVSKGSQVPACDVQAPLLSLPGIFQTSLETIPASVPYLEPDPELVEYWNRELESITGFKVGIAWQGSPTFHEDRFRSIPLSHFARLADIEGVRLISLQKGPGVEQLVRLPEPSRIVDLGVRLDEANGPFMDTAAVMVNLDLVIASDTAVPHLAGALGVPVWMAVHLVPDWRWLLHREDCPWYPGMRLFRQSRSGRWDDVFEPYPRNYRD